jgi:hypothetical protein
MSQEEVNVEGTSQIEQLGGGIESRLFVTIGTPCGSLAQIQEQFGRSSCLSHRFLFAIQTNVRTSV